MVEVEIDVESRVYRSTSIQVTITQYPFHFYVHNVQTCVRTTEGDTMRFKSEVCVGV